MAELSQTPQNNKDKTQMKITPGLLATAPNFRNCLGEITLQLRGSRIALIENFNSLNDIYEVIDLTDNEIKVLGNLPVLFRLKTILVSKNLIHTIKEGLHKSLPNLTSLSLISNNIAQLSDLVPLRQCPKLSILTLRENPVVSAQYYRLFVVWLIPSLKVLDFEKIKEKERKEAIELFGTLDAPTELATSILDKKSEHFGLYNENKEDKQVKEMMKKLTDEDIIRLKKELAEAKTLAEMDRIETALKSGYI